MIVGSIYRTLRGLKHFCPEGTQVLVVEIPSSTQIVVADENGNRCVVNHQGDIDERFALVTGDIVIDMSVTGRIEEVIEETKEFSEEESDDGGRDEEGPFGRRRGRRPKK